jgi:hypothetical protein
MRDSLTAAGRGSVDDVVEARRKRGTPALAVDTSGWAVRSSVNWVDRGRRTMFTKLLGLALVALAASPSAFSAAGGCHAVSGSFVNHNILCDVPALACVESDVTGGLAGVSTTVITGFDPATHIATGTVTNVLDNGAVLTASINDELDGGFGRAVETFTGGTRQFAHATGSIIVVDTTAPGVGTYSGEYCLANDG